MVDKLVEKVVIGEFCGFGEVNFGKQQIDFYIHGIGKIGDIIDVSYKTFEERVLMVLPELLKTKKSDLSAVSEKLCLPYAVLQNGLKNEGLTFTALKNKAKAMLK